MTATRELRTDELKPGMVARLKSRCGTLPQNEWFAVAEIVALPRKQFGILDTPRQAGEYIRPFAARTLWLVQEQADNTDLADRIAQRQRDLVAEMVRKGHATYAA